MCHCTTTLRRSSLVVFELTSTCSVYVRNLEERVKPDPLKEALRAIFSEFGNIIDIVAKTNLKAKGQAFIVYDNPDSARQAIEETNGFDLFEKPMQVALARTRSDANVAAFESEESLELHKRRRTAEKGTSDAAEDGQSPSRFCVCFVVMLTWILVLPQNGRRPSRPNSSASSARRRTKVAARQRRAEAPASRPPALPLPPSCPTSTSLRTRFSSCRTCPTTATSRRSPASSGASTASARSVWYLDGAASRSWSTRTRRALSALRRTQRICR